MLTTQKKTLDTTGKRLQEERINFNPPKDSPRRIINDTYRDGVGLTQPDLAEFLGVSKQTISNIEHDGTNLKPESAKVLGELFACDPDYLLCIQDERNKAETSIHEYTGLPDDVIEALHERRNKLQGYHEWSDILTGKNTPFDYTVEPFLYFLMTNEKARRFLVTISLDKDYRDQFSKIQSRSHYQVVADAFSRALEEVESSLDTDTYLLSLYHTKPNDHWDELSQGFDYWLNQGIKSQKVGNTLSVDEWVQQWFQLEPRELLKYLLFNSELKERDLRLQMWFTDVLNEFFKSFKGGAE